MRSTGVQTLTPREARRESIVRTAKELFFAEGYSATSMATIAAKVGGSKGTLYNYFPSKEQLFEAVVDDFCLASKQRIGQLDLDDSDFHAALVRFGVQLVRHMLSDDAIAMHRLLGAEAERFPELGQTYYGHVVQTTKAQLLEHFDGAMKAGKLRKAETATVVKHFYELCLSGLYRHRLWNITPPPEDDEIQQSVEQAVDAFLNGYTPRD